MSSTTKKFLVILVGNLVSTLVVRIFFIVIFSFTAAYAGAHQLPVGQTKTIYEFDFIKDMPGRSKSIFSSYTEIGGKESNIIFNLRYSEGNNSNFGLTIGAKKPMRSRLGCLAKEIDFKLDPGMSNKSSYLSGVEIKFPLGINKPHGYLEIESACELNFAENFNSLKLRTIYIKDFTSQFSWLIDGSWKFIFPIDEDYQQFTNEIRASLLYEVRPKLALQVGLSGNILNYNYRKQFGIFLGLWQKL